MSSLETIQEVLGHRRLAFVGLSTNEHDFSRAVDQQLGMRGYEVVPVNPKAEQIGDRPAYARVQDIPEPVEWVLVMTPPDAAAEVVADAHAAGAHYVWLHRGAGHGSVSDAAVDLAEQQGMRVVPGECPLMFLGQPGFIHNLHAFFKKATGRYPKPATDRRVPRRTPPSEEDFAEMDTVEIEGGPSDDQEHGLLGH